MKPSPNQQTLDSIGSWREWAWRIPLSRPIPEAGHPRDRSVVSEPELERLRRELRRIEVVLWVLVAVTGTLAVMVVALLTR